MAMGAVTRATDGRTAFRKLAADSIKNVLWYTGVATVILGLAPVAKWLAVAIFAVHGIALAVTVVQTAWATTLGIISVAFQLVTLSYNSDQFYWDLANLVQLAEAVYYVVLLVFIWRTLF